MNPGKYMGMAFEALLLNKVRSALTMLGIVIGVLAVIVMVGLGQASQAYITNQVKGLGAGVLIVTPGNPKTQNAFGPPGTTSAQTLKLSDVRPLETLPGVRFVSPQAFISTTFQFGRNTAGGQAVGTGANFQELRGVTMAQGRFFNEQESRTGAKVAVIGHKLGIELFEDTLKQPLESRIEVGDQRLRVVGVLDEQGSGLFGSVDNQVFMPTRTFQTLLKGGERLNSILIKAEREEQLSALQPQVSALLRQRHGIRPDEEDDFKLQTQSDLLKTVTTVTQVFTLLLAGIAAISLLVGGIGIMNIMLVTVTERTREIGVRKALGAKRRDILIQFLIESAAISLAGGVIGIVFGLALTWAITRVASLPFVLSPVAIVGGALFSVAVGIFFGLYPADRASKLDPVDALRYE
jgi:putative ABC transport system permease protein